MKDLKKLGKEINKNNKLINFFLILTIFIYLSMVAYCIIKL